MRAVARPLSGVVRVVRQRSIGVCLAQSGVDGLPVMDAPIAVERVGRRAGSLALVPQREHTRRAVCVAKVRMGDVKPPIDQAEHDAATRLGEVFGTPLVT